MSEWNLRLRTKNFTPSYYEANSNEIIIMIIYVNSHVFPHP